MHERWRLAPSEHLSNPCTVMAIASAAWLTAYYQWQQHRIQQLLSILLYGHIVTEAGLQLVLQPVSAALGYLHYKLVLLQHSCYSSYS